MRRAEPVVGMLEVVENDLSKNLAGLTLAEMRRRLLPEARAPEKGNQGLQETGREVPGAEEFWRKNQLASSPTTRKAHTPSKLNDICVAEAETYNEKVRQRFAEVARIKEALPILFESAFLKQRQALHWLPVLNRYLPDMNFAPGTRTLTPRVRSRCRCSLRPKLADWLIPTSCRFLSTSTT